MSKTIMPRRMGLAGWLSLLGLVLLAGCGKAGNQSTIHGQVTLDGAPLAQGSLLLTPLASTAGTTTGADIKDGRYDISTKGPTPGRYRVQIDSMRGTGKRMTNPMLPPGQTAEVMENVVAAKFNSASILEVEVKPGDNEQNFAVESK